MSFPAISSTLFSKIMVGSIISIPNVTKKAPKASPLVCNLKVAEVSEFAITLFELFVMLKISAS